MQGNRTRIGVSLGAAFLCLLLPSTQARGQTVAGYSEYILPGDELNMYYIFTNLDVPDCTPADTTMHSVISVTSWSPNTTLYYDHWENGYNFDPNNPGATADETYTLATAGTVKVFESSSVPSGGTPPAARNPANRCAGGAMCYDGGDRIYVAGGTVTVTRAVWLQCRGAGNQGDAWEIYPVKPQLTTYVMPFGEDLYAGANGANFFTGFERVYALIQATEDNTTVTVDLDHDGSADVLNQNRDATWNNAGDGSTINLSKGQSFLLDRISACRNHLNCITAPGTLNSGAVITGNKTLQVKYVVGRMGVTYAARGLSAFPRGYWTNEYYAPYGQGATASKAVTDYYLFNPWTTNLTVNWQSQSASGSFVIGPNTTQSYNLARGANPSVPVGSGLYFSADRAFWGVGFGDATQQGTPTGQAYEWGYSLLPTSFLYREHFFGWSPGSLPLLTAPTTGNGVFLTVIQDNTRVFVDYDGNGTADQTYTLSRLQSQFVPAGPEGDLSGARFWGTGQFTLAYGENGDTAATPTPNLDLGYVALPATDFVSLVLTTTKSANPAVVSTASGSYSDFTIKVDSQAYSVDGVYVVDTLPPNWQYVPGFTTITKPDLTQSNADPTTITGAGTAANPYVLTWSAAQTGGNMAANQEIAITFRAQTTAALAAGTLSQNNVAATGTRTVGSGPAVTQTFTATDFTFVTSGDIGITKTSNAGTPAYPGDTFTYSTTVTDPAAAGTGLLTGISLNDPVPSGLTDVAGTTTISRSTVGDSFNSRAYNLNVGTRNWATNWIEAGDTGGGAPNGSATQGDIQITAGGELRLDNSANTQPSVSRAVSTTGATSAILSFRYRTDTGVDAGDHIFVQAGTAGTAGACTTLAGGDITGIAGASSGTLSFDISAYIGANTTLRFTFPAGSYTDLTEFFYIDDLSITYNVPVAGLDPPELLSASYLYALVGGQSLTTTFNVTVDDPFPTGQTLVTNTASVTAVQLPIPLAASKTDVVANPTILSATVEGRIWLDGDGDGLEEIGEPGIANVQVTLKDQYGTPVVTALTDSLGRFIFTGVSPGAGYYIQATAPPDPAGAPLTNLTQSAPSGHSDYRTNAFTLSAGQDYTGADEGYKPATGTVSFGDLAWIDPNGNGVREAGEVGFGGVSLRLYRDANGDNTLNTLVDAFVAVPTAGAGTIAVTNGSITVTGTSTKFTSLGAGDPIVIGGVAYPIAAVASDTSLTLTANYTGATASGLTYKVLSTAGAGTVAASNLSVNVVGTGTAFTSLLPGDPIDIKGVKYKVSTVTDATHITLTANYTGATAGGLTYGLPTPTVSGSGGSYLFTGVTPPSGTYFVIARIPSGYTSTTGIIYKFLNVTSGTAYLTADFGFNTGTTYTIKDRVWRDFNGNGLFDNSEVGIAGVTFNLLDASLNVIATTTTDGNGVFTFSGLAGGGADYTTQVTDTGGVLPSFYGTTSYAIAAKRLEPNLTASIDRSAAPSYGYNVTRAIGDTVYNDSDGNGTQGVGEPGLGGIVVSLYRDVTGNHLIDDATPGPGTVATTAGSPAVTGTGTAFLNYHAGEPIMIAGVPYTILSVTDATHLTLTTNVPTTQSGLAYTGPTAGAGTVSVTNGSAAVTGAGTTFTNFRAGDPITINNGGTTNVVYTILSITDATHLTLTTTYTGTTSGARAYYGPGDALLASVATDANGQYLFAGLADGGYIVSVPTPAGNTYIPGGRADTDALFPGIQLAATISGIGTVLDRDFGFKANTPRTVSGTVWNDANANGVVDTGEARLAGVTVDLLNAAGTTVQATTTTDSNGAYSFPDFASGTYTVQVTDTAGVLTGYNATYQKTGGTGGPFTGREIVDVSSGDVTNVNFGYEEPGPTYASVDSLTAFVSGPTVTVQWRTSSEIGTVGFHLLRYDPAAASFRQLDEALLPGLLVHPEGGVYRYRDDDAPLDGSLTYKLIEVDLQGRERELGPFTIAPSSQGAGEAESRAVEEAGWAEGVVFQRRPNEIAQEQQERTLTAAAEELVATEAATHTAAGAARITTDGDGLYYVSAAQIGTALGITSSAAAALIAKGGVDLTGLGADVAYLPTSGGSGFYFYADQPRTIYSAESAYLLTASHGTTMGSAPRGSRGSSATSFAATLHREENNYALPVYFTDPDGDFWCWDYVIAGRQGSDSKSFTMRVPGVAGTGAATLKVRLHGGSATAHQVAISWNGVQVGDPQQWDGTTAYDLTIPIGAAAVKEGDNALELQGILGFGVPYSIVYLDYFELTYQRLFRADGDELTFTAPGSSTITVSGFSSPDILVLDLGSSTAQPSVVSPAISTANDGTYQAQFATPSGRTPRSYLASVRGHANTPVGVAAMQLAGLKNQSNRADYVFIAPDSLLAATNSLAAYRSTLGLPTMVVALKDIYNEFNNGNASPYAIRAFLSYAVSKWQKPPRYALLVGRGTYDYTNYMGVGDCLVPPLMTATPYGLFVSDNRIADLSGEDGVPQIALGRLPVLTSQDVRDYLTKIQAREHGSNPSRVLLTADNPDAGGSFNRDSDAVAALVPTTYAATKVYLPAYSAAEAEQAIVNTINSGVTIFNYIGHGGPSQLADEKIFQTSDVSALTNATTMPIFLGMTCAAGNFGFPGYPSLAEKMLLKQGGGVYASWASSGLSENGQSILLDKAFFTAYFQKRTKVVGDIVVGSLRSASAKAVPPSMKNLYNLLGEPVSRLP